MSTGWLAQSSTTSSARWITYAVAGGTESTVEAARTASVCLETSRASHLLWHLVQVLVPYSKGLCLQRDVRAHKGEEAWRGKGSYGGRYSGCPSSRTGGARCPPPRGSGGASLGTPPGTGTPPASSGANEVAGAEWVEAEAEAVWAGEAVWAEAMDRGGSGARPRRAEAALLQEAKVLLDWEGGAEDTRPDHGEVGRRQLRFSHVNQCAGSLKGSPGGGDRCASLLDPPANVVVSCHQCGTSAASRHRQL